MQWAWNEEMKLRLRVVTTKKQKINQKTTIIQISFNSKDSKKVFFTGSKDDKRCKDTHNWAACDDIKKKSENEDAKAVQDETTDT